MYWETQSVLHKVHQTGIVDEIVGLRVVLGTAQMVALVTNLSCYHMHPGVVLHTPMLVVRTLDQLRTRSVSHLLMSAVEQHRQKRPIGQVGVAFPVHMASLLVQAKESTVGSGYRSILNILR